jgi:hypothetical protein
MIETTDDLEPGREFARRACKRIEFPHDRGVLGQ